MQLPTAAKQIEQGNTLAPLNIIRTETVLSKYPIHKLSKRGDVSIRIMETSPNGITLFQWQVSHNSEYGQPGELAYGIDTLIVNRRFDEAERPLPRIICLGSLRDICRELDLSEGGESLRTIKRALLQNASAFITAKVS